MSIPTFEQVPEHLLSDLDLLYHGTNNVAASKIDLEGLKPQKDPEVETLFQTLKHIYEVVLGRHVGPEGLGFGPLHYYWSELRAHGVRPIALSKTFRRCMRYAAAGCCGGEVAESVAKVRPYLLNLINDPQARTARQADINRYIRTLPPNAAPSYHDRKLLDVAELERQVEAIEPTMRRLLAIRDQYQYGVIYAIRLNLPEWLDKLEWESGGGFCSLDHIPASALIGKVIVRDVDPEEIYTEVTPDMLRRLQHWANKRGRSEPT